MDIQIQPSDIIKKFKLNGHHLDANCLSVVQSYLSSSNNQQKTLKALITKINQTLTSSNSLVFGQQMLKSTIQLLTQGGNKKFNSIDEIIQSIRKWCIFYISPYQCTEGRFFIEKPQPHLFKFDPKQIMTNDIRRFRQIESFMYQQLKSKDWFVGMLYEDFSKPAAQSGRSRGRLVLQNQANELQIVFGEDYEHKCYLIPGCVYAVKGKHLNKTIALNVEEIRLPTPLPDQKNSLLKQKFKVMCENIRQAKGELLFEAKDFYKYSAIFNQKRVSSMITLVFGTVRMNKQCVERIFKVCSQLGNSVECIIFMLDQGEHEEIDLGIWFKGVTTYIIPHVNNEGPRLLPKLPLLKKTFNGSKTLTNPAKFSCYGRQTMFLNYPVMKNLYQKNILTKNTKTVINDQNLMTQYVSDLLFCQSTTKIPADIFPNQQSYFSIKQNTLLFIADKAISQATLYQSTQKKTTFVSVGNFERDGEFVCFIPGSKDTPVQTCKQPKY